LVDPWVASTLCLRRLIAFRFGRGLSFSRIFVMTTGGELVMDQPDPGFKVRFVLVYLALAALVGAALRFAGV
jgi:hypothetical protein